jgi:hypothetical protein
MNFLLNFKKFKFTHNYRSYMFQSSTILRELVHSVAKVTPLLKHSVKLRRCILCGDVAACLEMVCVLFVVQTPSAQQTAHTPFQDMLPHLHTIYNDVMLLNVLTEV